MEKIIEVGNYIGNNTHESMSFLRPAADILINANNEQCNIEAVKFSASNIMPLYRIFGMPAGLFVRIEEIFGNTLGAQQHTIDTVQLIKLNKNVSKSVNIQDDTLYYPVGSFVSLAFNNTFANDEVYYIKELIITHTGAEYTLMDPMGNTIEGIPSGLIVMKSNSELGKDGQELILWERKDTLVYRVVNENISDVESDAREVPPEVQEMIKSLEGKTPEEAMAIMAQQQNPVALEAVDATVTLDGVAIEPSTGEMAEAFAAEDTEK